MISVAVNINGAAQWCPTDDGARVYNESKHTTEIALAWNLRSDPLWLLMAALGPRIRMGGPQLIVANIINIKVQP